ncbi:MAG TPA: serine/threonine-protein phosphatase [Anaerolineae bacterium]|nr:serine/threonine-protein phosphatase [Anaerolineae bacterium]
MEPTSNVQIYPLAKTHPGMKRKNNEDRFSISTYHLDKNNETPSIFVIVADGVGGNMAGEVAAEIAVNTITSIITNSDTRKPISILENAIVQASTEIYNQSIANPTQTNMGSTCVCAWVVSNRLYIANVGDSRIYLIRRDGNHQLTIDHSWIQDAIKEGILSPSQAIDHPRAHLINRYLGSKQQVVPDFRLCLKQTQSDEQMIANQGLKLKPKDIILLCTDGLTDVVKDEEIFSIVTTREREQAIDDLIVLANERGGPDNITIALLENQKIKQKSKQKKNLWIFAWLTCLLVIIAFMLIVIISAGVLWYKSQA